MNRTWVLLLPFVVSGAAQAHGRTGLIVLDRTSEARPLVIRQDTDMSDTVLVDDNGSRPAIILLGGHLKLGEARRHPNGFQDRDSDPGLGSTFDNKFLPELKIGFSHHDFARAFVAAMGTFNFECPLMTADTCVSVTANPDGSYGKGSIVNLGSISGYRFGVLASGQENLTVNIATANAALWGDNEGPGHTFYGNECRLYPSKDFMRLRGVRLRIGTSTSTPMAPIVRGDHVTAKFKGSFGVDYECLNDNNACGAFDQFGSSGVVHVVWAHPGGEPQNGVFTAFRSGGDGGFGSPPQKFMVRGTFDCSKAPDSVVPSFRWETKMAAFSAAALTGGGSPVIWDGTDVSGLMISH